MSHIELPEGHVALRICVEGKHFDIVVKKEAVDLLVKEHGAELLTDDGLWVADKLDVLCLGESNVGEMIARAHKMATTMDKIASCTDEVFVEVPHLYRFEYSDRPLCDMGPVARPVPSSTPHQWKASRDFSSVNKRRARNKVARKARRKNRGR